MNLTQLAAVRDELITEIGKGPSPLAVKFQPALQDQLDGKMSDAQELASIKAQVSALVNTAHTEAIGRLREELANDPTAVGYAGKTAEEIQVLLTTERAVYIDQDSGLTSEELVNVAAAKIRGEDYTAKRDTVKALVFVKPPRVGVIWAGIPYARNLPSLDNIAEAQS